MEPDDLLEALNAGDTITGDSPLHEVMHRVSQDALRITGELNGGYQEPAHIRELLAQLTGKPVDESVTVFPPFYSDFGKNITLGARIFIIPGVSGPGRCRHWGRLFDRAQHGDCHTQPRPCTEPPRGHAPGPCRHRPQRLDRL